MKRSTSIVMSLLLMLGVSFGALGASGTEGSYVESSIIVMNDSGSTGGGGKYRNDSGSTGGGGKYRNDSGSTGGGGKYRNDSGSTGGGGK